MGAAEADRSPAAITSAPPLYPWWLKLAGIVLFAIGFAPLMQPTWYEVWTTAVLGTVTASLAVAAGRLPRLATVLPLVAATTVSLITLEVFARTPAHGGSVLLMLPALFYFVPGDHLSAATAELAAGFLTTGANRLVHAVFLLVQLYLGVILGLVITGRSRHALFDVAAHGDLPLGPVPGLDRLHRRHRAGLRHPHPAAGHPAGPGVCHRGRADCGHQADR
ncbi:threonine/serine exporter family protein [Streptomyces fildesensis]|uniref:threonine/serine exporter family protein n=1 Tax=Streptomyces fildesensis TaxID=375757 RepID=UPI001E37546E|nr:threonine/serine exporter family protein [Streptomyces fildesensis]